MHNTIHTSTGRGILALMCMMVCVLMTACGADASSFDSNAGWYEAPRPTAYERGVELNQAESFLIQHNIAQANQQYTLALERNDPYVVGTAAAGKSVTSAMLIGDEPAIKSLLINGLGATNSRYDTQRLIWGREGVLYWFEQGGRWEDDGSLFLGVKSLVADDLPWSLDRLESVPAFVSGLNSAFGTLTPTLIEIAGLLQGIEQDLRVAINDPRFEYFYLPSSVFHDEAFSLALNKSELAALHGMLSMARGAIYMFTAYEHTWTLEQLFGSPGAESFEVDHIDYAQLDGVWLRQVQRTASLTEARRAFQDGLDLLAQSISFGLELPESQVSELSIVRWDEVSREDLRKMRDLLEALSYSLDEPTKMPHFSEDFTLDLSVFFDGSGRTLDPDITWFDYDESSMIWSLTPQAEQAFLLDGVFLPAATTMQDYPARFALSEDQIAELLDAITWQFQERLSQAYGL